jgi:hypothetical protein
MRFIILIALLLLSPKFYSQTAKKVVLIDETSSEPVPYATIGSGSFSIFSDNNGSFDLNLIKHNQITISRLGYEDLTIQTDQVTDTINLVTSTYNLNTVEIIASEKRMEAGLHDMKTYGRTSGKITQGVGVEIKDLPKNVQITTVYAHTKRNKKGATYLISLFTIDSLGLPGKLIYAQNYTSPNGRNKLSIPIDKLVRVDDGLIVVFDWVSGTDEDKDDRDFSGVRMTNEINESLSFLYAKPYNKWIRLEIKESIGFHWNYKLGIEYIDI